MGSDGITVNIFGILNERRDLLLGITEREARLTAAQEAVLFYNDWIPLWFGSCLFLAFISSIFCLLPTLIITKTHDTIPLDVCDHIRDACWCATALAGFG